MAKNFMGNTALNIKKAAFATINPTELLGVVKDEAVRCYQGTRNIDAASVAGVLAQTVPFASGGYAAGINALLGVRDNIAAHVYQCAVRTVMGPFPLQSQMQVIHLDNDMCQLLIDGTRVYDGVVHMGDAIAWDVRKNRSGDVIGRLHTRPFEECGLSNGDVLSGISTCFSGIAGVELGERTMVVVTSGPSGVEPGPSQCELAFGGLRVRAQPGFSHYGVSVPSRYVDRIVLHTRGFAAVHCHFQSGEVNKSMGCMAEHRNVRSDVPTIRVSQQVSQEIDYTRVPQRAPLYKVRWSGNTQSVFSFENLQFLNMGGVTVLLDTPATFNVLLPSRRANTVSYVAAIVYDDPSFTGDEYRQVCNEIASGRAGDWVVDKLAAVNHMNLAGLEFSANEPLRSERHCPERFKIHTFENRIVTTYRAIPAGFYDPTGLPDGVKAAALKADYAIVGRCRL